MAKMLYAENFLSKRADVRSSRTRDQIDAMLHVIEHMPGVGSTLVSDGMRRRYGDSILKALVRSYIIVYAYDKSNDIVYVYDLYAARTLR